MKFSVSARLAFLLLLALPASGQTWPPTTFSAYYGKIEEDTPRALGRFNLLIVHPGDNSENLDSDKVRRLREEGQPKTIVGYVSIGEDSESPGGPPLLRQDHTGPTFVGKDLRQGLAHQDYPAYFMDQRQFVFADDGFLKFGPNGRPLEQRGQDGHPDENGVWGSYYAKADDPVWQAKVFEKLQHLDQLGLDGFFLDTVDTASPWGDYGWTSAGMLDLVERIRQRYPEKKIVANRGLFYLGQGDRFAKAVDAVLFESLLTSYREETRSASVSQWARWHVQALQNDVVPAQKRTGLALLVLDYLEPEHADATVLVQSARTLLQDTPHCLSFSHPSLRIPGWTADQLLPDPVPETWPSVTGVSLVEENVGVFTLKVAFDGPVPPGAIPDLRVTSRTDVDPRRAAELPLTWLLRYQPGENEVLLTADGLDKETSYGVFFRLVSRSQAPQSPFAWTTIRTAPSSLPSQVVDLSADSCQEGLMLAFRAQAPAESFRVYRLDSVGERHLLAEASASPAVLTQLEIGRAVELMVVAVDEQGREGYPSQPFVAVPRDVRPAAVPGAVSIVKADGGAVVRWDPVVSAETYRLYVLPEGKTYRLPLVCKQPEALLRGVIPGRYRVFATTVNKEGRQSQPGPSSVWVVD